MSALLEIDGVYAGYGESQVLRGISLSVEDRGCVGICGPNGHGKTTLMRCVVGLMPVWRGTIAFGGADIIGVSPYSLCSDGLIYVPQGNRLFPKLTVSENLSLGAYSRRARARERENREVALNLFPRLRERLNQKCRTLSGGERQMLSIAVGMMAEPRLLILDEPNLGLAPIVKEELAGAITQIAQRDIALILIEEDLEYLLQIVSHLYVVNGGSMAFDANVSPDLNYNEIAGHYF